MKGPSADQWVYGLPIQVLACGVNTATQKDSMAEQDTGMFKYIHNLASLEPQNIATTFNQLVAPTYVMVQSNAGVKGHHYLNGSGNSYISLQTLLGQCYAWVDTRPKSKYWGHGGQIIF